MLEYAIGENGIQGPSERRDRDSQPVRFALGGYVAPAPDLDALFLAIQVIGTVARAFVPMGLAGFVKLVRHAESDTMGQGRQDSLKFPGCRGEYQAYYFIECDIGHGAA